MEAVQRLLTIMARLRDPERGCPWDLEQDFASIAPYTLEEAYEVADAIARQAVGELKDELGDLLLQRHSLRRITLFERNTHVHLLRRFRLDVVAGRPPAFVGVGHSARWITRTGKARSTRTRPWSTCTRRSTIAPGRRRGGGFSRSRSTGWSRPTG